MSEWWQDLFLSGAYTLLEDIPPERTETQVEFARAALGLQPGERLLDVACGIGRHSLPLAARDVDVTGLDYTPRYLAQALRGSEGLAARFIRGDMRRLPFASGRFDAATNLFTSFGYFQSDSEDAHVLSEIARVLRPGGRFLIDTIARDGLLRRFQDRRWDEIPGGVLLQKAEWDALAGRATTRWTFVRDGQQRSFTVDTRVYAFTELEAMLVAAGLLPAGVWGDWDGSLLGLDSRRMIVLAKKRG